MKMKKAFSFICVGLMALSCTGERAGDLVSQDFAFADQQLRYALTETENVRISLGKTPEELPSPRNIQSDGSLRLVRARDWCSGFFPGELWYMYEYTKDDFWKEKARKQTELLEQEKWNGSTHDMGFKMYCSYGNGYRLTGNPEYKQVIINTADSLSALFNPRVGTMLSWPRNVKMFGGHNTIMDNMINLEMLFWAAKNGGNPYLFDIAVAHADKTMKYHFRPDYTSYHVAVYDTLTGEFIKGVTHQGYSDDSMWARGQAWAIYGYTVVYRETKDVRYLDFVQKVTDVYLKNLPEDYIPYWDFNAPELSSGEPKDASASAITASALLELSTYINDSDSAFFYRNKAVEMLQILSSPAYQARNKKDAFLLHSVGHMNKGWEVDASISYADYYYLEALVRLKRLKEKQSVLANL